MLVRRADLRAATHKVRERNEASHRMPVDRATLHRAEAVVRMVEELAVFGLDAEGAVEVAREARYETAGKRLILLIIDIAVDWMEVAIAAVDIDIRWAGQARARGCSLGLAETRDYAGSSDQQKGPADF